MYLPSKVTQSLRALCVLEENAGRPVTGGELSVLARVPQAGLHNVLSVLRRGQIVRNVRGNNGGYMLARDASLISVADVMVLFGGFIDIGGRPVFPEETSDVDRSIDEIWTSLNESFRTYLASISVADIGRGILPVVPGHQIVATVVAAGMLAGSAVLGAAASFGLACDSAQ